MLYKKLGRSGWKISVISFGAWAIGGTWGQADDKESLEALHRAVELGVNFFDTADIYGDGHSDLMLMIIAILTGMGKLLTGERLFPVLIITSA